MNRRDFIKQAVAAGIAAGVKVFPVTDSLLSGMVEPESKVMPLSKYAEILGIDLAKPGSDSIVVYLGYSNKLETPIWKPLSTDMADAVALATPERMSTGFRKSGRSFAGHVQSILEEANRQTSWGQMVQDGIEEALTQEEGGFVEVLAGQYGTF